MSAHVEVWMPTGRELVVLTGLRVTIGKAQSNTIVLGHDDAVSRLHAVLEDYGPSWSVRDVGSRNGTFVKGEQIHAERVLHPGDELRVGHSRLVYRDPSAARMAATAAAEPAPVLTRREQEVLEELCRPLFSGEQFPQPASTQEVARRLVVSNGAIKLHLTNLCEKFGIATVGRGRYVSLAKEAIRRGAVNTAMLRDDR
jgi:hypothetical protein